jgi:hypothetical protein
MKLVLLGASGMIRAGALHEDRRYLTSRPS